MVDLSLTPLWAIEHASDDPLAAFAAEELRRTLQRLGGPALPIVSQASGPRIALRHGPRGDGFLRAPDAAGLLLRGDGPRGLLYAIYDLLEALGCRWVAPGPAGERVPQLAQVILPCAGVADRPALAGRSLIIGHDHFLAEAEAWVVWAAHNRLNTIFIHTIAHGPALGACRLRTWHRQRSALLPRITERGLSLELGGHHLSDFVPRRLFREQPELFRYHDGRRTPDANFCPSNLATQHLLRTNASAFFRQHPEAQVYHLWPDDRLDGGWCSCADCAGLSPAEQTLLATNTLAAALADLRPNARVSYLAYHDTDQAPRKLKPHPQVELLFAPRPRSYAQGIGDPRNPINTIYASRLRDNIAHFAQPHSNPAVFEYYLDGILFKSSPPPLAKVIAADLAYYRDAGVPCVHALMTGDRPWLFPTPNAYFFARLAWSPQQDLAALLATYAATRAPRTPAALSRAYSALAAAWHAALDRTPAEAAQRREGRSGYDPVSDPPQDVLDYMTAPCPDCEERMERLQQIDAAISAGRSAWAEVLAAAFSDYTTLANEHAEWDLAAQLLHFLALRQQLYLLAQRKAHPNVLRQQLATTQSALDNLVQWANTHVPASARAGHTLMRTILQLHLDHIEDQHLAMPWQRATLRARRALSIRALLADQRLLLELVRR